MAQINQHKVVASLPDPLEANSIYYVRVGAGFDQYVTNGSGMIVAYQSNAKLELDGKVDKEEGKMLSSNDYTTAEKNKLASLENFDDSAIQAELANKVDKVAGKGLSDENYTLAEKNKLDGIEAGAQVNSVTSVAGKTGAVTLTKADVGLGNVDNTSDANKPISTATAAALDGKVDKVIGKQLSTEDYTTAEKSKLAGIEAGAQVNVATNIGQGSRTSTTIPLTSSTGTGTTLPSATTSLAGLQSAADKAKLDGIATGATKNATDTQLRDRTTHTGVQPIASVEGLQDALDEKVDSTDPRMTNSREWTASVVSQAEAEAGTATTARKWTAQRVRQAILGWWNTSTFKTKLDGIETGATKNATDAQLRDRSTHTGTQPISSVANLQSSLDSKVDKVAGYGLSQENFTPAEKSKLASIEGSKFKGEYVSLAALQAAHPSPEVGSYAYVDAGVGEAVSKYIWDSSDAEWVKQQGETAALTPAEIKTLYEENPDTNAFTDSEKTKLSGIQAGATANATNAQLRDRSTHTGTQAISTVSGLQTALDSKVDGDDARLTNARDWTASTVTQAEAEAGTATTARKWTAQRVRQAILGWWNSSAEKTKLDGIATGATKNATDAQLRDRATHTGVQPISSVDGLQSALDGKVDNDDARLTNAREWTASAVSQAEAEAGTATTARKWTAQRVRQAILGWWNSSAEKTKLDGIATGATKNATDAQLRDRSTHTGTQAISTVSGLQTALDAKVDKVTGMGLSEESFTTAEKNKLEGIEPGAQVNVGTNLAMGGSGNSRTITSSTGNSVSVPVATTSAAGFMSTTDKSKLDGLSNVNLIAGSNVSLSGAYPNITISSTNTTYSEIPESEVTTGTASTARAISARRLKFAIDTHGLKIGTTSTTAKAGNWTPAWGDVSGKPTTFTPSAHTHTLSQITDAGTVAALNTNGSTANFLRGDGTWATPPNTTYTEITTAEIDAGTASTLRTITGRRMKYALDKKADVVHTHTLSQITDAGNVAALNTNSSTTNFLRGDGTWATPPNTTYSEISEAEVTAGTASTARAISARRLKFAVDTHGLKIGTTSTTAKAGNWTPSAADIPNLDASKITSGTLADARIPNLSADKITSGTIANARLSGVYDGITLKINGSNTVFTTPSSGSSSSSARTVYGLAEFRAPAASTVGAIVFIAPNTTHTVMHEVEIAGLLYNNSIVRLTVQGYRSGASGNWTAMRKISTGTVDVPARWGLTPDGKACIILGDVDSTWSYPHFSIIRAMFSHTNASDAYCSGWTTALVTDLTEYTRVTSFISDSAMAGNISGNAATATKLATARTINGTSFNGTANITTANWGTARTLTIGATGKSVNGSANVSWSLSEIGAAAASHTHSMSDVSGLGNVAGISTNGSTANYLRGDGTWVTPPNTTYSEITTAEIDAGTASTSRTISGRRMKYALDKKADAVHGHSISDVTGLQTALDSKADTSYVNTQLDTKVDKTVSVVAGTGLSGGGTLSANRTLSVVYGTTAGTAAQGNDPRLSNSREWTAAIVSQVEAEAGTATTARKWTAQRVRQAAIAALDTYVPGMGQTWQDLTESRDIGTIYTNTTGRSIYVSVALYETGTTNLDLEVDGVTIGRVGAWESGNGTFSGVVPNGSTYRVFRSAGSTGTIRSWAELR